MSRFENFLPCSSSRQFGPRRFACCSRPRSPAAAETVEVAPGVQVTKRTYAAPINEQPFFGFAVKNESAAGG